MCAELSHRERRREPRFPFTCSVEGIPTASRDPENQAPLVRGTVVDLSAGGACVLTEQPVVLQSVLIWRFHLPSVPVAMPVLMQVRGVQSTPSTIRSVRVSLAFIA